MSIEKLAELVAGMTPWKAYSRLSSWTIREVVPLQDPEDATPPPYCVGQLVAECLSEDDAKAICALRNVAEQQLALNADVRELIQLIVPYLADKVVPGPLQEVLGNMGYNYDALEAKCKEVCGD